jgi:hypothetical protein
MPNHITNLLTAPKHVIDSLKSEEREVDFNTVIPTPDDVYQGNLTYGVDYGPNWRDFNIGNWGTKWNAYDAERKSDTLIQFDTAWSHPREVIHVLSMMFPDETLTVEYADEDLGGNQGSYTIKDGVDTQNAMSPTYGPEAIGFAVKVKYGQTLSEYLDDQRQYYDETPEGIAEFHEDFQDIIEYVNKRKSDEVTA